MRSKQLIKITNKHEGNKEIRHWFLMSLSRSQVPLGNAVLTALSRSQVPLGNAVLTALRSVQQQPATLTEFPSNAWELVGN